MILVLKQKTEQKFRKLHYFTVMQLVKEGKDNTYAVSQCKSIQVNVRSDTPSKVWCLIYRLVL